MFSRKLLSGAALTALSISMGGVAHAQSTGSQAQEEETIVVTAGRRSIDGTMIAETAPKSRATITEEFIDRQAAGQSILQSVNLVPGVNFTNNDPYGSAGGNLRIRGFDGNRISLTIDGIPLNDTGNYAIYSNQQLDPELITRATVNMGTTDVDSPTASATGGTINYVTRRPIADPGLWLQGSAGEYNFGRFFGLVDTGAFGPWDTTAFLAGSYTNYDKFKGPGEIDKQQYNAGLFEEWGDGDNFIFVGVHYNRNRNNFYRNLTLAQFQTTPGLENDQSCLRLTPTNGVIDNESTGNTIVTWNGVTQVGASCTNYYNTRINPSDTGNIRSQMSFQLADNLRFTFDPSFQYVLANGGGFSTISETDDRLDQAGGNAGGPGVDLNGDTDELDTVMIYSPSTTNTRRWGINSSVIWDVTDDHRVRFAYTLDYGRHRQTGDMGYYDASGNPEDVYGGKDGYGRTVDGLDGSNLRSRDRASAALLNQLAFDYRGYFFDDALTVSLGLRAPMFMRRLHQMCYSQDGSSNVRCTTETATPDPLIPGNVTLSGGSSTSYLPPYRATLRFEDVLPNLGATWRFNEDSSIYVSYAEGLSAPRTDNLYTVSRGAASTAIDFSNAEPETTQSIDLGYRFQSGSTIAQIALWHTDYENRIVSAFDDDLGFFVDRNIGAVELQGLDAQIGFEPFDGLSLYASASFIESEMQDNIPLSATGFLPTRGRELVETPDATYAARAEWDVTDFFTVGFQGKYVGHRFATDVNDQFVPSYTVFDLDARLDLDFLGLENSMVQLNVINLFDEEYLGGISSRENAITIVDTDPVTPGNQSRSGSQPTYALGAPRTAMVTLRTRF
ncbi:MAG: TonB-dependent receptor [Caulobacteraceae bacterium]